MKTVYLIIGELLVILFLVIGVDYFSYMVSWLPVIIYNALFIKKIINIIPWSQLDGDDTYSCKRDIG